MARMILILPGKPWLSATETTGIMDQVRTRGGVGGRGTDWHALGLVLWVEA